MESNKNLRVVFMGTPEFAVEPLKAILDSGYSIEAVVTTPDKPAGRGQKMGESAVKLFAKERGLPTLQPEKLRDEGFVSSLRQINPDVIVVVAFRMLPDSVWRIPRLGTFNLHASLLPQYRGAAPINWAVMNGETRTGLTTFLIDERIDTGGILLREEVEISPTETAGELHDRLMALGGPLVVKTLELLSSGNANPLDQNQLHEPRTQIKSAPKLFKDTCRIDWAKSHIEIYNHIRGLSPYPGAWTEVVTPDGNHTTAKILGAAITCGDEKLPPQAVRILDKRRIQIGCNGGTVEITRMQLAGKRAMQADEVLRGLHGDGVMRFL